MKCIFRLFAVYRFETSASRIHHCCIPSTYMEIDTKQVFSRVSVESINEHMHVNI